MVPKVYAWSLSNLDLLGYIRFFLHFYAPQTVLWGLWCSHIAFALFTKQLHLNRKESKFISTYLFIVGSLYFVILL